LKQIQIELNGTNEARDLFGNNDVFLKRIEEELEVSIVTRGEHVQVSGDKEAIVQKILDNLLLVIQQGLEISERDVMYAIKLAKEGKINQFASLFADEITKNARGKSIRAKTLGQKEYVEAIKLHDLVFGIGPAGTGKTYLAIVKAVKALKNGE